MHITVPPESEEICGCDAKNEVQRPEVDASLSSVWLHNAQLEEILASDASHKSIFVLVKHSSGERGILLLNKSPFKEDSVDLNELLRRTTLKELAKNDVFGNYDVSIPPELNIVKAQLIVPANDKLIAKYRREDKFVIRESAEDYKSITLEYIEKNQLNLNWVYNVLNKEAEADRIFFEDPDPHNGFIIAPDLKWDGSSVENLYVLAIIHRKGVKSIRDLTANDVPMLESIREKSLKAIKEKYGVRGDQIRAYFHYQPSFFHLHVHFVNLKYEAPASTVLSAYALDDVINNLKLVPDYYQKATLTFTRKRSDRLLQMFVEAGRVDALD